MKKGLILMSLLMAATGGFARTLTPEEALQRVKNDNGMKRALQSDASASPQLVQTVRTSAGMPAVYLFNRSEDAGYMLVSADDVAMPLLGYSDEPVAADGGLPPSMQWWMEQYALEIEQATAAGAPRFAEPADAVDAVASFTPVSPLCATRWNQDAPYNDMCPLINGKRTYTGCLATALAQVMKYYEWPERGTGSITYKDENGTARTMSFDVGFDWDAMLNEYGGNATAEQKNAVALLMKACGYSVKMTYGTQASGASDSYVVSALTSYFGYDSSARLCQRYNYGLAEWQSMIYDNLKNIGPVLYCGSSHLGGHAFVCDGYSADGYYQFNGGWGGAYDGYFLLTSLNPEGQGIGGYAGGYN
ncbi:MAG: C10 family peptidase, partial [Muribaculaceae bacterium]|nr:C10 family peptidase [Muribaculaceae bacterium]